MQSRTLSDLSVLLKHLPRRRLRLMGVVLVASFLQGLLDMLLVGLMARMVGLLAGVKLQDQIPGIRVFGGSLLDQAGWLIGLLIAACLFTSIIRFFRSKKWKFVHCVVVVIHFILETLYNTT